MESDPSCPVHRTSSNEALRKATPRLLAFLAAAGLAASAGAQTIHPEVEPNDTKDDAIAVGPFILAPGDGIVGISASTGDPDYFIIQTTPMTAGIYRHRMVLDNQAASNPATLRGLTQSNGSINFGTDAQVQNPRTASGAGDMRRTVQWYGFGKEEQVFYRIRGSTASEYTSRLHTQQITPIDLGTFEIGIIEIATADQGHSTNTALWILDDQFNLIPDFGNDQRPAPETGNVSRLTRSFGAGTYYVALTMSQLAVPHPAPQDDRRQNAMVMDFPNAVAASTTHTSGNLSFQVTDEYGPLRYQAARSEDFEILWYTFTVGTVSTAEFGRCCILDGSCLVTGQQQCDNLEGSFAGIGTTCATPCPQPGGCCFADYSCLVLPEPQCATLAGNFAGENTVCTNCPEAPCWSRDIGIPGAGPVLPNWQEDVRAMTIHNGELYVGGSFTEMGGIAAERVARWDGTQWHALGAGVGGSLSILRVNTVASFNGDFYVGGVFDMAGGLPASRIARWDGELWHNIGSGLTDTVSPTLIAAEDMLVWDDGTGPALYIAGRFTSAGGVSANSIARWDGSSFSALGGGVSGNSFRINTMAAFQNRLYVGGGFTAPFNRFGSWDGFTWHDGNLPFTASVDTLTTLDTGSGPLLHMAASGRVQTFDGANFTDIGHNLPSGLADNAYAFAWFDDGSGPALYLGGHYTTLHNMVRLVGTEWVTVAGGVGGSDQPYIRRFLVDDNKLYLSGRFDHVGGAATGPAQSIAIYSCQDGPCYADCNGDGQLNIGDFLCFIDEFAVAQTLTPSQQQSHYANCTGATAEPFLTVSDFLCFIDEFAQGCP